MNWIDQEIALCAKIATPYSLRKAQFLMKYKPYQKWALIRELETLQMCIELERDLKKQGRFDKGFVVTYKQMKIKVIKQLLKKQKYKV